MKIAEKADIAIIMQNFRIYPFILLLFGVFSCTKSYTEFASNYATEHPSFMEKVKYTLKYGKWEWVIGQKLTLNKDSTFEMTTCTYYIKGQWYSRHDTLFLCDNEKKYKKDSLNYIKEMKEKLSKKGKTTYYLKKGKHLERKYFSANNRFVFTKLGIKTNSKK